eukprot:1177413-Karenia_brevis.AAC.1
MQAFAWGLREAWRAEEKPAYGMLEYIASKVTKVSSDRRKKEHPSPEAVGKFFAKLDDDPEWFPGKLYGETAGRKRALSTQNEAAIATSAMAMKHRKVEPTYQRIVAACPAAVTNPETGEPIDKGAVYT